MLTHGFGGRGGSRWQCGWMRQVSLCPTGSCSPSGRPPFCPLPPLKPDDVHHRASAFCERFVLCSTTDISSLHSSLFPPSLATRTLGLASRNVAISRNNLTPRAHVTADCLACLLQLSVLMCVARLQQRKSATVKFKRQTGVGQMCHTSPPPLRGDSLYTKNHDRSVFPGVKHKILYKCNQC